VNLPFVAITFVAIWIFAPESRDEERTPLDPIGALLSIAGLGALVFAIIQAGENGFTDASVLGAGVIAIVALVGFLQWERRTPHPMLPLRFFENRHFSVGSGVITTAFFVMFGFFFLVTQYLQFARSYSPLEAGLALLPFPILFIAVSPRSATLMARFGAPKVMASGLVIIAGAFVALSMLTATTPYFVIALTFAALGTGMSLTAAPATSEIMSAVPLTKAGVGSAVNDTTRELGGALGIAIFGSIVNSAYRAGIDLSGIGLPNGVRHQGEDSIGAAAGIANTVRSGGVVHERAAGAFTDAFNLASAVSIGVALVAAAAVLILSRPRRHVTAADDLDLELEFAMVPVTSGQGPE
jgi:Na+/melibiose symporter-like transporter